MAARTLSASRTTSSPTTSARPALAVSSVVRMRTTVVLPAPFGPSSPSTLPSATVRLTPSSAVVSPKRLTSPSTTMASVIAGTVGPRGDGFRPLFAAGGTVVRNPCRCRRQRRPELIAPRSLRGRRVARTQQGGGDLRGVFGPPGLQHHEHLH